MRKLRVFMQDHMTSFRTILFSFFAIIILGAFLLMTPYASADGNSVPFINALFTAASATCVTGLVVYDTATQWSLFGKTVILILIQIGGLGVITITIATLLLTGRRLGIIQRMFLQDSVSAPELGSVDRFTRFFLRGTFLIEGIGALMLFPVFAKDFGYRQGLVYAVFHSVSAFCNAGFDLMGVRSPFSSMTSYASSAWVNVVLVALILIGGAGFLTWQDLLSTKFRFKALRLQTKVILSSSLFLVSIPFLYFYFLEFSQMPGKERVLYSLFQTVTPRTAGFNTYDYGAMSEGGLLVTIILMLVGGAPGSTAGGMKITTLFVILMSSRAFLKKKENVSCFKRRIENDEIQNAFTLFVLYISLLIFGTLFLSNVEKLPVMASMFETASAIATVGLTTGITPGLSAVSKLLLICYMYFGRAGGLTLAYALASRTKKELSKYPAENMTVG